ncbi:GerMN domain-containing protein [Actinoplanes flavus]|uniref:GerMN domain-containing protein n=1 Tax=Actinoplanes flavus TaxID=2820290 RepID=A0ABS3V041_9ACTN|nr:GerMN domain-containing protein [Actinoplanes flavus]MBO3744141.1 GerMN domain-containing protein [Actinoplanes flavus]
MIRVRTALLTVALVLAGCGVPAQDDPHRVELPRRPLNETVAPTVTEPVGEVAQVMCLVRDDRLVQSVRRVDAVPGPQRQLDQLIAGPTPAERAQDLSTALATTALTVTVPTTAVAAVEVGETDERAARSDEVLAYGQIVCTLTSRADIAAVSFQRAGRPLQVPRGDLTLTSEPLRAADYRSLIGPG